jgi:hypothetical protein
MPVYNALSADPAWIASECLLRSTRINAHHPQGFFVSFLSERVTCKSQSCTTQKSNTLPESLVLYHAHVAVFCILSHPS